MAFDRTVLAESLRVWLSFDPHPPGGRALQWLWTALLAAALAAAFTIVGVLVFAREPGAWFDGALWARTFARSFVVCGTIAGTIHLLFELFGRWAQPRLAQWSTARRTLFFAGLPMLGATIGWPLGMLLVGSDVLAWARAPEGVRVLIGSFLVSLLLAIVLHRFFSLKGRQLQAEKRATEAQLALLQAQMEPHFLFNTLANVQSLIGPEPARATAMLESFTDYLRATLAQLRTADSTLEAELALAESFLRLLQSRMEERLAFEIRADERARGALLPPLVLQPLVENAIRHGLEPKIEGGRVSIAARVEGQRLIVDVSDDGLGLQAASRGARPGLREGAGVALANLRERLQGRYGSAASLTLGERTPGTVATLVLPYRSA